MILTRLLGAFALLVLLPFGLAQADDNFTKFSAGIQSSNALIPSDAKLWPNSTKEDLLAAIENTPDIITSRSLGRALKSALMMPIPLDNTRDIETVRDVQDITAIRIQKLLAMGAFKEASHLVNLSENDDIQSLDLITAIVNVRLANNNTQAACLDLLSFQSGAPDIYTNISPVYDVLVQECTQKDDDSDDAVIGSSRFLTLGDIQELDTIAVTMALNKGAFNKGAKIIQDTQDFKDAFKTLSPYKQSLLLQRGHLSDDSKLSLMGYALSRDLISLDTAQSILNSASNANDTIDDIATYIGQTTRKPRNMWLGYLEPLRDQKLEEQHYIEFTKILTALSLLENPYHILPYASQDYKRGFAFSDLNYAELAPRKAYIAAMAQALSFYPPVGNSILIAPSESAWIFTPLTGLTALEEADLELWLEQNLNNIHNISPDLDSRLAMILAVLEPGLRNIHTLFLKYGNKKTLTHRSNYVMHNDDSLKIAETMAKNKTIGSLLSALASASNKATMDQFDPEIVADMMRLLYRADLEEIARNIAIESLAHIETPVKAELGEQQN